MARQRKPSEIFRSITGGPLVGLGLHILLGNVDRATTQLTHLLAPTQGRRWGCCLCCFGGLASLARFCL